MKWLFSQKKVTPQYVMLCAMCLEPGVRKRKCCNADYCDHCYTKNKCCPNCKIATRQEKLTKATYTLTVFSEHEECRSCLDPGLLRRCCGNYYCDECYYALPTCRSCNTPIGDKKATNELTHLSTLSILISILLTAFLVLGASALIIIISITEIKIPQGIYGYNCYGFFRTCDKSVCININQSAAFGLTSLPPLTTYSSCTLSSAYKLESQACVYDSQLYESTGHQYGYDICASSFQNGVYIFEDTFEHWTFPMNYTSNLLASAFWSTIINGQASAACGPNLITNDQGDGGNYALVFYGSQLRYAETMDMNLLTGGWVEFDLFLAPLGYDSSHPFCQGNYAGNIDVLYSTDQGVTWTLLGHYESSIYRTKGFFKVILSLPTAACNVTTRLKFSQPYFTSGSDGWAIDNVKVLRKFASGWQKYDQFQSTVKETWKIVQHAQCCFDTEWCNIRLSEQDTSTCNKYFTWFKTISYNMRLEEIFIILTIIMNALKFIYITIQTWLMSRRIPFHDEFDDITNIDRFAKLLPPRYRPKKKLKTQADDSHYLARIKNTMHIELEEAEGEGERRQREEEIKREEMRKLKKKNRAIEKKLKKQIEQNKMKKNKHFKGREITIPEQEINALNSALTKEGETTNNSKKKKRDKDMKGGEGGGGDTAAAGIDGFEDIDVEMKKMEANDDKLMSEMDRLRRLNIQMTRTPFEHRISYSWRYSYALGILAIFVLALLYQASTTEAYTLKQNVNPYNLINQNIYVTSLAINLFAIVSDFKEIYYILKNVIPLRSSQLPLITIDSSEGIYTLFIGRHVIPLSNITHVSAYDYIRGYSCAVAIILATFPICLISLIVRNRFLTKATSRVVIPVLGSLMMCRALLGPTYIIKIIHSLYYLFAYKWSTREAVGKAFRTNRSINSALIAAVTFCFLGTFFTAAINSSVVGQAVGISFLLGLVYGAVTGASHDLPVHPWIYLTTLDGYGGVCVHVQRKQKCPCVVWYKWCTDMHLLDEILILHTTDDRKLLEVLKKATGIGTVYESSIDDAQDV